MKQKNKDKVDVVIVGGGPSGATAAKNCARHGMHTLLLEKEKLPRHKPCSGLIVSSMARAIIAREFGLIPDEVLTDPPKIFGWAWHTTKFGDEPVHCGAGFLNVWREDLDYWMVQKARESGVEIWEETCVIDITEDNDGVILKIKKHEQQQEIRAKFAIGADGGASIIRKRLFPKLNVQLGAAYEECHLGSLNVDKRYLHEFGTSCLAPSGYQVGVLHKTERKTKRECFIITGGSHYIMATGRPAMSPKNAMALGKQLMAERYGFHLDSEPIFTAGHALADLRQELWERRFLPAKGNILLVGDAAGITTGSERHSGEGINMALKSGILAASAIIKALDTSQDAAYVYLADLQPVISTIKTIAANVIFYQTNWIERERLLNQLI